MEVFSDGGTPGGVGVFDGGCPGLDGNGPPTGAPGEPFGPDGPTISEGAGGTPSSELSGSFSAITLIIV